MYVDFWPRFPSQGWKHEVDQVKESAMNGNKVQQQTVVTQVMGRIKELIASGTYKTNDRIPTETELVEMFGVGRSSVREAVKTFQYLGVLESRVPKGTFVCDGAKISQEALTWAILLNQNSLDEILDLRRLIERDGIASLVEDLGRRAPEARATMEQLEAAIEGMKEAARDFSIDRLVAADYRFHDTIIHHTGNALFCSIYETLQSFMQEEIARTYQAIPDKAEIAQDHQEILDTVKAGDPVQALGRHDAHFARIRLLLAKAGRPGAE